MLSGMAIPENMLKRVVQLNAGADDANRESAGITEDDSTRILEIACMVVTADGNIADEELAAVRVMDEAVRGIAKSADGKPVRANDLQAMVGRCTAIRAGEDRLDRLRNLCEGLSSEAARHLAYKVSMATAMADLASSDEEFELDIHLLDSLQITNDVGDRLAGEVHEALTAE